MADAYTGTGSVAWDQPAWNRLLYFAFREENVFDQAAEVKPTAQTNPGASVTFFLANDLTPVSTALNESLDVDAVALSDATVTIPLVEEGNAVVDTQLLRLTSMIPTDPAIANILGANAGESMDLIARNKLQLGTNVAYSGAALGAGSRATRAAANVLTSADVRIARNRLRRNKVPKKDGAYTSFIHPDVLYDFRTETGGLGWMETHKYVPDGARLVYSGEVGEYEGFRFVESVNSPVFVDAGTGGTVDVYRTIFMGAQALAKGFSNADGYGANPITVKGPVVDKLERFQPWGWKHFVGYGIFRQAAIWSVESASSVAVNT
jgi:N4-gp56 family major capsid protein